MAAQQEKMKLEQEKMELQQERENLKIEIRGLRKLLSKHNITNPPMTCLKVSTDDTSGSEED